MLEKVEKRRLTPLDVIENDHQGCPLLEQLAEGRRDFLSRRWAGFRLTEKGSDGRGCNWVGRKRLKLLDHLDDRPIRDALAVREATPLNDLGLNRGKRLRD